MNSSKLRLMLGGGFITLTAVWLLVSALGSFIHTSSFVKSGTKVKGVVVRVFEGPSAAHYAVYAFKDDADKWHASHVDVDGTPPHSSSYKEKDEVPLIYPPDHPEMAEPATFNRLWWHATWLGAAGLLDLLLGLGVLWYAKSQ